MITLKAVLNARSFSKWLSDESLTKKASLNAFAAFLDYVARLVIGLVITPFLVAGLGNYLYGVWQILARLIGYISAASGRPTQALKWTIAHQQTSTNHEEKRRQVGSTIIVWLLFLPLLALLGGVLAWFAPVWLHAPLEVAASVRLVAALLVVDLIMTSLTDVPRAVLEGENLGYKRMGLSAALVLIGGSLTGLALYLNAGLIGVAVANLATTLLTGVFFLQVVRLYAPWFGIARPSLEAVRRFFGLSWWFFIWRLVNQLMMASDVLVLGMLSSVENVTTYTLTKYTPETVISLVAIVVFGITPGLGGIIGAGKLQKAAQVRSEIMTGTWLLTTAMGITILLWNQAFMHLWVGGTYYAGSLPTLLVMLMTTQFVLIRNDANIIDLTLKLRNKVLIGLLSAAVALIFAGVLVGFFNLGITGLCLGFILGRSILSVSYPWLVGRSLEIPFYVQLKSLPRPAFVMGLLIMLALSTGGFLTARTWIGLVFGAGVTFLGVLLLAFFAGLSHDKRTRLLHRVQLTMRSARAA